mmetsp:Transcript_2661/g.7928  ORF Transcript_2661/g.7928 Transcript_2661/m.7928 type:complete len:216 (+) Transcript_2661:179-826(+)
MRPEGRVCARESEKGPPAGGACNKPDLQTIVPLLQEQGVARQSKRSKRAGDRSHGRRQHPSRPGGRVGWNTRAQAMHPGRSPPHLQQPQQTRQRALASGRPPPPNPARCRRPLLPQPRPHPPHPPAPNPASCASAPTHTPSPGCAATTWPAGRQGRCSRCTLPNQHLTHPLRESCASWSRPWAIWRPQLRCVPRCPHPALSRTRAMPPAASCALP